MNDNEPPGVMRYFLPAEYVATLRAERKAKLRRRLYCLAIAVAILLLAFAWWFKAR